MSWPSLGDGRDRAVGAHKQDSTGGVRADRVELQAGSLRRTDTGGVIGRAEIIDRFTGDNPETDVGLVIVQGCSRSAQGSAIVGNGGVIGLRENFGERPCLAAVVGERQVGPVLRRMLIVPSGDHAVEWITKGNGKD